MPIDVHVLTRIRIDRALAGEGAEDALTCDAGRDAHLAECAVCQQYLADGQRAIASLNGLVFPVDAALAARVHLAIDQRAGVLLDQRARQQAVGRSRRRTVLSNCAAALALLIAGSVVALQLGSWMAGWMGLPAGQVERLLLAVWVVPSLCFALVFPALPVLSNREGGMLL